MLEGVLKVFKFFAAFPIKVFVSILGMLEGVLKASIVLNLAGGSSVSILGMLEGVLKEQLPP